MIDLMLKILALAMLVFVWGFAWTWAADREEAIEAKLKEKNNG